MSNAFLFPGQGSQKVGMGQNLYDTIPSARDLLDQANDILGYALSAIMFEDPGDKLSDTRYAQPAIFVCSAMYLEKAKEMGLKYDYVSGHSLGEYSALYAAGVFDFETGLRLVKKRAFEMSKTNGTGGMAAVLGLSEEDLKSYIDSRDDVVMANLNTKTQIVLSGSNEGIEAIADNLLGIEGVSLKRLNVSGPFHSPYMNHAAEVMEKEIQNTAFDEPSCNVVSNVTGKPTKDINEIKDNLISQITGQVRWYDSIMNIKGAGIEAYYECGYGKVLRMINKTIILQPKCLTV